MVQSMAAQVSCLQSVSTALDLLDCFVSHEELGVSDVARQLGIAKSTAHRLLTTLCSRGFAERNAETGRYRLGLHLYELGTLAISRSSLRRTAIPLLRELHERSGCTIHLAVADGAEVIQLERLESARCAPLFSRIARRHPVHSTACGKAIAALDPTCAAARIRAGFPECTPSTIRTAGDFERELTLTKRRGFAVNHDETRLGLTSVGVPGATVPVGRSRRCRLSHRLHTPSVTLNGTRASQPWLPTSWPRRSAFSLPVDSLKRKTMRPCIIHAQSYPVELGAHLFRLAG